MSYDVNGRNSRQDILEEIERVLTWKASHFTESPRKSNSTYSQRHPRHGNPERPLKREDPSRP